MTKKSSFFLPASSNIGRVEGDSDIIRGPRRPEDAR